MSDPLKPMTDALRNATKIAERNATKIAESHQRGANEAVKEMLQEKREQITATAKAMDQVAARKMASVYEQIRAALAIMKEHGLARGKLHQKTVSELAALDHINRDEAERAWTMLRRYKTELQKHGIDVETITRPDVKEEQKAYAKMMADLNTFSTDFKFDLVTARKIAPKSIAAAREIFQGHIKLPHELNYDEVMLLAEQERLKGILPEPLLIYLEVAGMFSSAKTYLVWLGTMLAGGEMIYEPTEAGIYRTLQERECATLGIDQIDLLMKKAEGIASLLLVANRWNVPKRLANHDSELGVVPITINVGGVKFYSLYEQVDKALTSRSLRIDMQRHIDADMIIEFLLGSPKMAQVKAFLMVKAAEALDKWTKESVVEYMRSPEYKAQITAVAKKSKLGRDAAVAGMILLLGHILEWDVQGIIDRYLSAEPTLREKTELYKTVMRQVRARIVKAGVGFTVMSANANGGTTLRLDEDFRRLKADGSASLIAAVGDIVEAKSLSVYKVFNDILQNTNTHESVGTGAWGHVLEELEFVKGENWIRIRARSDPWEDSTVLRFTITEIDLMEAPK